MPVVWRCLLLFTVFSHLNCDQTDPNGYVAYCPCMGRFGNQADHFLGSLAFAHALNRTLVLPHWVEYRMGEAKSIQVPFDTYFAVAPLENYHRVITMNEFMSQVASQIWPENTRTSFCYVARGSPNDKEKSCNAKEGNPFGPFWDTFNIDFVKSEFYAPLHYDVRGNMVELWKEKYSSDKWPVLAFTGAPASFPVQDENRALHKYLQWSDDIAGRAKAYIKSHFKGGGFVGIHLRNGPDWVKACEHVSQTQSLFAAPQCIGYRQENGPLTYDMCLPTKHIIIRQLKRLIKNTKDIKYLFVASDSNHMMEDLTEALKRHPVLVHRLEEPQPHLDLAILALSNQFIGNCVSSYSAFVKRERDVRGLPSFFWAFPAIKTSQPRDEL